MLTVIARAAWSGCSDSTLKEGTGSLVTVSFAVSSLHPAKARIKSEMAMILIICGPDAVAIYGHYALWNPARLKSTQPGFTSFGSNSGFLLPSKSLSRLKPFRRGRHSPGVTVKFKSFERSFASYE
jgi:hypothetical protein